MEETYIEINYGKFKYKLLFDGRVNLIRGDSATGKTTLYKILSNYYFGSDSVKLKSNKNIQLFNISHLNGVDIDKSQNNLYILDEGKLEGTKEFANVVNSTNSVFIIITRKSLPNIAYDKEDIYELKYNSIDNSYINSKIYGKINNKYVNKNNLDKILVEDSGSGKDFFSTFNLPVESSKGISNLSKIIKNNSIIVFDSLGSGPYINDITLKSKDFNNYFIHPKSFEYMLLESKIFPQKDIDFIENNKKNEMIINKEKYYYTILREVSKLYNNQNIIYVKSKLPKWYTEIQQKCKICRYINNNFSINLEKLNKNNMLEWS